VVRRRDIMKGKIKWYNFRKGYGFIEGEDGKDIFVHRTSVPKDIRLNEGDEVEYNTRKTEKGLEAIEVVKL